MKKIAVAAVIAIWCAPSPALADERVGDAALGAVSGAVVLGPSERSPVPQLDTQRDPLLPTLGG